MLRVTGAIVELNIKDNSRVQKGDLLFVVDQKPYKVALLKAIANKEQAEALFKNAERELVRAAALEKRSPGAVPTQTLNNYQTTVDTANANLSVAEASIGEAQLNLSYTEVKAPANGYVTNLRHHVGSQVMANNPVVALIDEDSFWIEGFLRKQISRMWMFIRKRVSLCCIRTIQYLQDVSKVLGTDSQSRMAARVTSYCRLLTLTSNGFAPVRVKLTEVPDNIQLRVGMTASVQIHK